MDISPVFAPTSFDVVVKNILLGRGITLLKKGEGVFGEEGNKNGQKFFIFGFEKQYPQFDFAIFMPKDINVGDMVSAKEEDGEVLVVMHFEPFPGGLVAISDYSQLKKSGKEFWIRTEAVYAKDNDGEWAIISAK